MPFARVQDSNVYHSSISFVRLLNLLTLQTKLPKFVQITGAAMWYQ